MPTDADRPEVVEIALKLQAGSVLAREVLRLREQRAADLADLRAAAQDLHDLGNLQTQPLTKHAYTNLCELAAARVERVIARIHHRAGETTDER